MIDVLSLGVGKQSSYMLLNALQGKFKTIPSFAIFADTGCEPRYVYDYLTWIKTFVLEKYGFEIVTVRKGDLAQDTLDFINGKNKRAASLPVFSEISGGPIPRQCTSEYKVAPVRKYLQSIRGKQKIRLWIGISLDEIERMKTAPVKYIENYYPLVESRIGIDKIVHWFKENNLQEPGKSACSICPFHSHLYWQRLKSQFPDDFKFACDFDDKIRQIPSMRGKTYLSRQLKPLREINYKYEPSLFPELIEECYGLCGL
jgi:hypothetical protein